MGQYHIPVNLTKRQYIDPHRLGCGLKQWEQIAAHPSTGTALLVLLFSSNCRGGGDLAYDPIVGSWAGDQIAIIGDYSEDDDLAPEHVASTIYGRCGRGADEPYVDVTDAVVKVIERELGMHCVGEGWKDWVKPGRSL